MTLLDTSIWGMKEGITSDLPQCGRCGLFRKCQSPKMPPTGVGQRRILFVGEAPGEEEDKRGEQLIGKAGQCLRKMLGGLKVDLDDCWKTNAFVCRPPSNISDDLFIESCRPNLLNAIKSLKPAVVVLLGISAVKSLVVTEWSGDVGPMGKWVGWAIPSQKYGVWICPTYHPSFVARTNEDPTLVKIVAQHLKRAIGLERSPVPKCGVGDLQAKIEVISKPRLGRKRMLDLASKGGILAVDFETTGLKPESKKQEIYTSSFCLEGQDTFACAIDESNHDALREVLANPRLLKVASNAKFEHRWALQKLGVRVASWHWDTMLAAHVGDNRPGITSVKFQTFVYFGIGEYNQWAKEYLSADHANDLNRIKEAPLGDILVYNGMDSLLEFMVMEKQKEILNLGGDK